MTSSEILRWIPALRSINRDLFCNQILPTEMKLFGECVGYDFRDAMLADAIDYSSVEEYQESKVYDLDELVYFDGLIYKSLVALNYSVNFVDDTKWETVSTFANPNFNDLWVCGMAKWIGMSIYKDVVPFITYQASGKGVVKQFEDSGQRTIETREYYTYIKSIESQILDAKKSMMFFYRKLTIINQPSTTCGTKNSDDCDNVDEESRIAW